MTFHETCALKYLVAAVQNALVGNPQEAITAINQASAHVKKVEEQFSVDHPTNAAHIQAWLEASPMAAQPN